MHIEEVGFVPSFVGGLQARVYKFKTLEDTLVCRCYPPDKASTFSFFARATRNPARVRVTLKAPYCSQSREFLITLDWVRYELSLRSDTTLSPLEIHFKFLELLQPYVEIAFEYFQVERGLVATSPMSPGVIIPMISSDASQKGVTRAADCIVTDSENTGLEYSSSSFTTIALIRLKSRTDQIMPDEFLAAFSVYSHNHDIEYCVGVSGSHKSKFVIRHTVASKSIIHESFIVATDDEYFIALVFNHGFASLFINGVVACEIPVINPTIFNRTYIGCSHSASGGNLNGYIQRIAQYFVAMNFISLLTRYRELCPQHSHQSLDYFRNNFSYAITSEDQQSFFDAATTDDGYSYFVSKLDYALPQIYEQYKTHSSFTEENIRDWVYAHVSGPGENSSGKLYKSRPY